MARGNIRLLGVQAHMYEHGQWIQNGYSTVIDGTQIRSSPADLAPRTESRCTTSWALVLRCATRRRTWSKMSELRDSARACRDCFLSRAHATPGRNEERIARRARAHVSALQGAGSSSLAFTVLFPCSVLECKVQGSSGDGLGLKTPAIVWVPVSCVRLWWGLGALPLGPGPHRLPLRPPPPPTPFLLLLCA